MAIQSFGDKLLQLFFETGKIPKNAGWQDVKKVVARKLDMLHYAHGLGDLKSPPGNKLELLKGDLSGFYGIRVNDQWRIVFQWKDQCPVDVQVLDYH